MILIMRKCIQINYILKPLVNEAQKSLRYRYVILTLLHLK